LKELQGEIFEMRDKIYKTKNPPEGEFKNLKHSYTDNIGLLNELFRLELITSSQFQLADIYQTYHRCLHETVLQNKPAEIESGVIAAQVEHVVKYNVNGRS